MDKFSLKTTAMIFRAIGKSQDSILDPFEIEELGKHYEKILANLVEVAHKELEAYLVINSCRSYDQLAKLIIKRERKNLSEGDYEKLLARLRTRAHRGREKLLRRIRETYHTEDIKV